MLEDIIKSPSGKNLKIIKEFSPEIEVYNSDYVYNKFDSGEYAFNEYINKSAKDDKLRGDGVTYIIHEKIDNESKLIAYYTISASTVHFADRYDFEDDDIPEDEKRERYSPISAFSINMFAVNKEYQDCIYEGYLISDLILKEVILNLYKMSVNVIGAKIIILCSVTDAIDFYKRNGFKELSEDYTLFDKPNLIDNKPMYLVMHKY